MPHDIIDNREVKLIDELARRFPSSEKAKFAVGYFFLSGLEPLREQLYNLQELRLLIGNTTNRETIEQISEGYRRLEPVQDMLEAQAYPKRAELKARLDATVENMREAVELMEQIDTCQQLVATLVQLIAEKRLQVRVYNRGRLHAKAYIFDYGQSYDATGRPLPRTEPGVAIIGSSNFTLSGISHNTELNVVVHGKDNHERLTQWFEDLWNEADDFDASLMEELEQSWPLAQPTPYDIYMKTLYALVRESLEEAESGTFLWSDDITAQLADFQRVAVRQAVQIISEYGGCFVADVVGLGKSYIGAAIVKHFERTERARPLIICPKPLVRMWERYNEVYQLNAHMLPMSLLRIGENGEDLLIDDVKYKDRDFVLVDESHNFRNPESQRYQVLQRYLEQGRRCVLLTATPRARNAYDAQTNQRIDPDNIALYLSNQRQAHVEVGGRRQTFPRRELRTAEYSIEDTYAGLYDRLRMLLGRPRDIESPDNNSRASLKYYAVVLVRFMKRSEKTQPCHASYAVRCLGN